MLLYFGMLALTGLLESVREGSADCIWPEDYTRAAQQTDEEVRQTDDG